ncbi:MAG: SH3 domain-containing protein [Clostridia bacterium]|nr:SH3 domain-containing protein [Clostridia bacterium]
MNQENYITLRYPEWYKIEKDTEKTIKKLSSIKDLVFYLKNPDEYIRRIAILRIGELNLKESINYLKEILDDPIETTLNKELAAWTIKSVSLKRDVDLFISSKLLSKYSGSEKYTDIYGVSIIDDLPSIKFEFSSQLIEKELHIEGDSTRHSEDINFDVRFSFNEWFRNWYESLIPVIKNMLCTLPSKALSSLKNYLKMDSIKKVPHKLGAIISKLFILFKCKLKPHNNTTWRKQYKYFYNNTKEKTGFFSLLKNLVLYIFYLIFTPLRLIIRHNKVAFTMIIALYCFLAFTTPGKIITYKQIGMELTDAQSNIYTSSKEILAYAWSEFMDITGISTGTGNISSDYVGVAHEPPSPTLAKTYVITAQTGLTLRKSPSTVAEKAQDKVLPYNSSVLYLSKSQRDSNGSVWYFVKTADGNTGWVYTKWLKETGGEENVRR